MNEAFVVLVEGIVVVNECFVDQDGCLVAFDGRSVVIDEAFVAMDGRLVVIDGWLVAMEGAGGEGSEEACGWMPEFRARFRSRGGGLMCCPSPLKLPSPRTNHRGEGSFRSAAPSPLPSRGEGVLGRKGLSPIISEWMQRARQ